MVSDSDKTAAAHKLASLLLELPNKFMMTVFFGEDASAEERDELKSYLSSNHPDAEIYYIDGEQKIYPFIFAAE